MGEGESSAATTPDRAPRLVRFGAFAMDALLVGVALDCMRLALIADLPLGRLNAWVGGAGAVGVLYLAVFRGWLLPSPGYYTFGLRRYKPIGSRRASVVRDLSPVYTSAFRAGIVALAAGTVAARFTFY